MNNLLQKYNHAQSFNINVITRILKSLSNNGPLKITTLTMYSRLNYNRCKKYLYLMKALNWISIENDVGCVKINCTISGKRIMHELVNFMEKKNSQVIF